MNRSGAKDKSLNKITIEKDIVQSESIKRKRGRPKGNLARVQKKVPELKTKMVDGKLMKRAFCVPKKVLTGKPGRPRKEYVWIEVKEN